MQQNNQSSSVDVEAAIHSLASAGHDLPREAMRWALDHWDEAAPDLLTVLERLADGTDRSEEAASGAFFVAHLAAEKRDARAFRPVCRVARDAEAAEAMLGDALTLTLKRILISTYDGDLAALRGVIEARDADPFARGAALEALAYLAATGRVARDDTEAYLRRLFRDFQSEPDSLVWLGWQEAVALLGLESLDALVREAFERELVDPSFLGYEDFREDLERTLADPARMAGFAREQVLPLDDAVAELSGWYGFSAEAGFAKAAALARAAAAYDQPPQTPAFNPYKHVGRNDPCPCGSGKKFKKCCLPRVSAP